MIWGKLDKTTKTNTEKYESIKVNSCHGNYFKIVHSKYTLTLDNIQGLHDKF